MHVFLCLDDRNGMLFNGRRLSSDRYLCARIMELTAGTKLWMNGYSAKLFEGADICVVEDFLEQAGQTDGCFVENVDILPYLERIESITVFFWNRAYPSDVKFPVQILEDRKLDCTFEFAGSSHERITQKRYIL